jgi:hypothetical protein
MDVPSTGSLTPDQFSQSSAPEAYSFFALSNNRNRTVELSATLTVSFNVGRPSDPYRQPHAKTSPIRAKTLLSIPRLDRIYTIIPHKSLEMLFGRSVFGEKKIERVADRCPKCGFETGMDVLLRKIRPVFFGLLGKEEVEYVTRCGKGHINVPPDRDEKMNILRHLARVEDDYALYDRIRIGENDAPIFDESVPNQIPTQVESKVAKSLNILGIVFILAIILAGVYILQGQQPSENSNPPTTTVLANPEGQGVGWGRQYSFNLTIQEMTQPDTEVFLNNKSLGLAKGGYFTKNVSDLTPGKGYFKWVLEGKEYRAYFEILPEDLEKYGGILQTIDGDVLWEHEYDVVGGYLKAFTLDDPYLRGYAKGLTSSCDEGDTTCKVVATYENVTKGFRHYPKDKESFYIQAPKKTILLEGGEYDDLNVLLITLLANSGVDVYIVSTKAATYGMACGVDDQSVRKLTIAVSLKNQSYAPTSDNIALKQGLNQMVSWGRGFDPEDTIAVEGVFDSTQPITAYFARDNSQLDLFLKGKGNTLICRMSGVNSFGGNCTLPGTGVLAIRNEGFNTAKITYTLRIRREYSTIKAQDMVVTMYDINGEKCAPIDATFGENGYAGLESDPSAAKMLTDPKTKERIRLTA